MSVFEILFGYWMGDGEDMAFSKLQQPRDKLHEKYYTKLNMDIHRSKK